MSEPLNRVVSGSKILPAFKTDHAFPQITINQSANKKGPGYWQMNTSHLGNVDYDEAVKKRINETCNEYNDIFLRWGCG